MADWRQIQARIRKAKNSPDAVAKLSELFQRTRDAMVAWELGAAAEKAAQNDEAAKWYLIAVDRFRRLDWKKKAEEALTRLGVALPQPTAQPRPNVEENTESFHIPATEDAVDAETLAVGEIAEAPELAPSTEPTGQAGAAELAGEAAKKKRRRGRRGGRGRRKKDPAAVPPLPTQAVVEPIEPQQALPRPASRAQIAVPSVPVPIESHPYVDKAAIPTKFSESAPLAPDARRSTRELPIPQLPSERTAHGRAGDPALASRIAQLESMLRRLVASPLHRLEDAELAPAGPGVFLLSDSDQITSYYAEACQTLRVGVGNLVRGGRSGKSARGGRSFPDTGLKEKLAEHLGIDESKVSQYMKDHCVIRWIQLDDDALHLAHFAVAVLRTPLNLD